jgi:colanic acid biosynthesis protein WcaH
LADLVFPSGTSPVLRHLNIVPSERIGSCR